MFQDDKIFIGFYNSRTMKLISKCSFQTHWWEHWVAVLNQCEEISATIFRCSLIRVFVFLLKERCDL